MAVCSFLFVADAATLLSDMAYMYSRAARGLISGSSVVSFCRARQWNCWHCQSELIWNVGHDIEEEYFEYFMVTNLGCPSCEAYVEVYAAKED